MRKILRVTALATVIGMATSAQAQIIISGNDEKSSFNDAGKLVVGPPARTQCRSSTSATALTRASSRRCR